MLVRDLLGETPLGRIPPTLRRPRHPHLVREVEPARYGCRRLGNAGIPAAGRHQRKRTLHAAPAGRRRLFPVNLHHFSRHKVRARALARHLFIPGMAELLLFPTLPAVFVQPLEREADEPGAQADPRDQVGGHEV